MHVRAGLPAYRYKLVYRLAYVQPLAAHVAGHCAAVLFHRARQEAELTGVGKAARGVLQPQRHAPGALAQVFVQQAIHFFQFRFCGRTVIGSDHAFPQAAVAHQQRLVDRHAAFFPVKPVQKLTERGAAPAARLFFTLRIWEGAGAAVAGDLRGDALEQLGRAAVVLQEHGIRMGMGIYKAGRHGEPPGIEHPVRRARGQTGSDRRYHAVLYFHVRLKARPARAVQHRAAPNQQSVHRKPPFICCCLHYTTSRAAFAPVGTIIAKKQRGDLPPPPFVWFSPRTASGKRHRRPRAVCSGRSLPAQPGTRPYRTDRIHGPGCSWCAARSRSS